MATRGSTSKPTSAAEGWGLNVENNFGVEITMPSGGPWRIYKLGAWLAGWNATPQCRLVVWSGTTGSKLGQSATFNAANGGAISTTASVNYEKNLESDIEVSGGADLIVGFARDESEAIQFSTRSTGRHRERDTTGYPTSDILAGGSWHGVGDLGAYLFYEAANDPPTAPTINEPDQNEVVNDTTPTIDMTHNDPDGDPISAYQILIDNNSGMGSPFEDSGKTSTGDETPSHTFATVLTRGNTYYVKARTWDDSDEAGPYSGIRTFTVASLPVGTITSPAASCAAPLYYTAGSDTTPKLRIGWSFSCAEGGSQSSADIKVYADDGAGNPAALLHTHAHSGSATTADISGYAVTNGTKYHVSVTPTCSHGAVGNESAKVITRVRWGRASYFKDLGATPLSISSAVDSVANSGTVVMEYAFTADASAEPTDWKATLAESTFNDHVWHRVTLLPQSVASPTSPVLNSVAYSYSANALSPDKWTMASIASIDTATKVFGTQSLKHIGDGTSKETTQSIAVEPDTNYILSGRIKTSGTATATLELYDGVSVVASIAATDNLDWTRYSTPVWNSQGATSIIVRLRTQGTGTAWFDALKVEASAVVTPWTPGFIGAAVVLDAGGLNIDASAGGIFRLLGSSGDTSLDTVKLGAHGLDFGNVEVYCSASDVLSITGDLAVSAGVTAETLRLTSSADMSLSSTDHGLQIGPDSGANLAADANEIMARNNGVAATLHLNADGGDVVVRGNGSAIDLTENGNMRFHDGFITFDEVTSTPAALANAGRLFVEDNGSGKSRLRVRFGSGAIQTIATEP